MLTINRAFVQVGLRDVSAALKQELALPGPLLPQPPRHPNELRAFDVVKHDNVRACIDRFVRFFLGADLDFKQKAESADLTRLLDSVRDRAWPHAAR